MRYPVGTTTRLFIGCFFLGSAVLLLLAAGGDGARQQVALAAVAFGVLAIALPSHVTTDDGGLTLTLLGCPAGKIRWSEVRAVNTQRAPLRRVHVTQIHGRGRPKVMLPAELVGYRALLAEIAVHAPAALDELSAALAAGEAKVATLEHFALALLTLELAAFGYLALRLTA